MQMNPVPKRTGEKVFRATRSQRLALKIALALLILFPILALCYMVLR